jgi:recombination protein RecT
MTAPKESLLTLIHKQKPAIEAALPKHLDSDRMMRIAITAIRLNPKLQDCTPDSFLGSLMVCSQLGLEPNTPLGQAWIIPYKNGDTGLYEATFQIGYKGLLDLSYRTGNYAAIRAEIVYEKDEFDYSLGFDHDLKHKPAKGNRGKVVAYYALYKLKTGGRDFKVMYYDRIMNHAKKHSKSYHRGPWQNHFDQMAQKTVLKEVLKYAPMSTQDRSIMENIQKDNAIITLDSKTGDLITDFGDSNDVVQQNLLGMEKFKEKAKALAELE